MALQGVAGETSHALGTDPDLPGVGAAALVIVEVRHEAQRPGAAHLGPEGVCALRARGQRAVSVSLRVWYVMT